MERRKLLIADGSEEFRLALRDALQSFYSVRVCRDGKTALELLTSFRPDILVLDLMLAELDGISLLQSAPARECAPMVLATTRFANDYVLESMTRLEVGYLMMKPCDIHATVLRIRDLHQRLSPSPGPEPDPRVQISNILLSLGIPTKLRGYAYLREAVYLFARDPGQSITKELYPAVGAACSTTAAHVERSIRSAISSAWEHRDGKTWQLYFQPDAYGTLPRPTNAAFISRLADGIHMMRQ